MTGIAKQQSIIPPSEKYGVDGVHVVVVRDEDGGERARFFGPEYGVATYKRKVLSSVQEFLDGDPELSSITPCEVLKFLSSGDTVIGRLVPPIVRYSALAIIQEYEHLIEDRIEKRGPAT